MDKLFIKSIKSIKSIERYKAVCLAVILAGSLRAGRAGGKGYFGWGWGFIEGVYSLGLRFLALSTLEVWVWGVSL